MANAKPENIEYIARLKFASVFQYCTSEHSIDDLLSENYFHVLSSRFLEAGDEVRAVVRHEDGSWSKVTLEVSSVTPELTVVEPITEVRTTTKKAAKGKKAA